MFEPVIIGAAQLNDRDCVMDPLALMEAALRGADADAGGGWLGRLGWLGVVSQISFPNLGDCSGVLAERLGASPKVCFQTPYPMGDSPILLLNEAANRIGAGEIEVAAVVGAEALRTAARMPGAAADATRAVAAMGAGSYRGRYGLVAPTDIYPLYENACRAAWGQSLAEAQGESAEIWARFSEVAAGNEGAWLRTARTAGEIATPSAENRPVAFPYLKLMVANAAVNQGAGFLVTSRERALAAGVDEARLVYVGRGAAARETEEVLARDSYARSASMEVCLRRTLELNGWGIWISPSCIRVFRVCRRWRAA
jgi:acetyl-CoA C-acetyltransferase